jgi:hypothetical protein
MTNDEREARLIADIRNALHDEPVSTADARHRVMAAVRAAAAEPNVDRRRAGWRSPAAGLLVAASVAGIAALVHTRGITYTPASVPGIGSPVSSAASTTPVLAHAVDPRAVGGAIRVQFVLVAPAARHVAVVGDFNDWNPATSPLESVGGVWSSEAVVSAGRHDYAFVIDGAKWIPDPAAPRAPADELGGGYSVLVAGARP